jgi:hypothetical protein
VIIYPGGKNMSAATVEAAIQGHLDRIAKICQGIQELCVQGTDSWTRSDAADDETYENRVKGSNRTAVDNLLQSAVAGIFSNATLKKEFSDLNDYFNQDLSLASPYFASYIASKGWRVPYNTAEALVAALGSASRLPAQYVFPKGTLVADAASPLSAGMHRFGRLTGTSSTPTYASDDGALPSTIKGAAILAVNEEGTPGLSNLVVTATNQAGAAKDLTVTVGSTQYTQEVLGQQAIGAAGAAAGQKVVPIAATGAFAVSEWVLLVKADLSVMEVIQINTIQANTSLTMLTNLKNSFVENDLVWPLFTNVTYKSGTVGDGKHISFYARPDRIIAL